MNISYFSRYALTAVIVAAFLTGCGGVSSGSMPVAMTPSGARHSTTSSGGTYLYVMTGTSGATILTYPSLKNYATIAGNFMDGCVDSAQHTVFLSQLGTTSELTEYAIGGTEPIAHIVMPTGTLAGPCVIDPTTGNLAVIVEVPKYLKPKYIAVYSGATSGKPKILRDTRLYYYRGIAYDPSGNLFVDGMVHGSGEFGISEIRKGSHKFIALNAKTARFLFGPLQWAGKDLVQEGYYVNLSLYRMRISGRNAIYAGHTNLRHTSHTTTMAFIYGDRVAAILFRIRSPYAGVGLYQYPQGGHRVKSDWNLPKNAGTGVFIANNG